MEEEGATAVLLSVSERRGAAWFAGGDGSRRARVLYLQRDRERKRQSEGMSARERGRHGVEASHPRETAAAGRGEAAATELLRPSGRRRKKRKGKEKEFSITPWNF